MLILPNTPPIPGSLPATSDVFPSHLSSIRASLSSSSIDTYNDLVRYVVNLEEYVEDLFEFAKQKLRSQGIEGIIEFSKDYSLCLSTQPPWLGVLYNQKLMDKLNADEDSDNDNSTGNMDLKLKADELKKKLKVFHAKKIDWMLFNEMEMAIISTTLVYTRLGGELINDLIELDIDQNNQLNEINEKWKQVISFYKRGISFIKFAQILSNHHNECNHLNGDLLIFLEKINNLSIQMSILCKSSWLNRNSYNENESFKTTNNGTLCRVAIYVMDELKNANKILNNLSENNNNYLVRFNNDKWSKYLSVIERYALAYAGLFLSIETYQQDKLGQAIGLLNFCLLNLQSKRKSELTTSSTKLVTKFKSKISAKKNEQFIKNLQSVSSLNLNDSLFNEKSGIILKDLNFLFDQLVQLHLKFTKENDNLKFEKVADFQDIHKDNKWPLGSQIPVSDITTFSPKCLNNSGAGSTGGTETSSSLYPSRGAYY